MIIQIKYAYKDIKENPKFFAVYFLQLFVGIMLIGFCINKCLLLTETKEKITSLGKVENMYVMRDVTPPEVFNSKICQSYNESIIRMKKFMSYLESSDSFEMCSFEKTAEWSEKPILGKNELSVLTASEKFIEVFNLNAEDGKSLKNIFSSSNDGYIHVAAGSNFKSSYKIGDVICDKYCIDVFLNKDSFYTDPLTSAELISLNSALIVPVIKDIAYNDFASLDTLICGSCIITDEPGVLKEIQNKSTELNLYSLEFTSYKARMSSIIEQEMMKVRYAVLVVVLILIMCVVCISSSLITFTERHMKEFAVHLLCGAALQGIAQRLLFQVGIMIFMAFLLVVPVFFNFKTVFLLALICFLMCAVITAAPILKVYLLKIRGILKRCE